MKNTVYIVLKDWIDYCICGKNRIIHEFTVENTTLSDEVNNSKKLSPKKVVVDEQHNKLTLFV